MERSNSQKIIRVISIFDIIGAVLILLMGLMAIMGGALVGVGGGTEQVAEGLTAAEAGGIASMLGVAMLAPGIVSDITGILGIRASNDASKIMPVWVLAIVDLVLQVLSLISSFASGAPMDASSIIGSIVGVGIAGLMFWAANNVKAEAGK